MFWGVYPIWLLVWNWAYLILAVILVWFNFRRQKTMDLAVGDDLAEEIIYASKTARLWIYPLLAILFYMHALLVFVSVTGTAFR